MEHPPTPDQLEPGEAVADRFCADRAIYWRGNAWLAAIAMAIGMGALWVLGNPHIWTGAIGGLAAIAVRAGYLASEEMTQCWHLTDRRIIGPSGQSIPLSQIAQVNTLFTTVQIVTRGGDKHLIKHLPNTAESKSRLEAARNGAAG
jgi:hypothetical protein